MIGNFETREIWLRAMDKIAGPVLEHLANDSLKRDFPFHHNPKKAQFTLLEAFGRTMDGIAPWLALSGLNGAEADLQNQYRMNYQKAIANAVNPRANDYMNFSEGSQPLVDAAFLSHAIIRAPKSLAESLPGEVKENLISELKKTRDIMPYDNNWMLFSAMVEGALYKMTGVFDRFRIERILKNFMAWYKGDGVYGDGEYFHWDYYNSFVIHPMYVDLLELFADILPELQNLRDVENKRATRYAAVLERMIAPDGTYPIIGRSICYRFGAFQMLSQAALEHKLGKDMSPAQVRCALTAVIEKVMENPSMFDDNQWLQPGVYGYQPELGESYINAGSLYLCSTVFLPLGLPKDDDFWRRADEPWTSRKVFDLEHIPVRMDHALSEE